MVRSISGPSGKVAGSSFVIEDQRNRFVYPSDKSLVVYFEWDTAPGAHTLVAMWKQPDGKIATISPDVKIEIGTRALRCYWNYTLVRGMADGVWSVEIRIDGRPAGFHAFEVVGAAVPPEKPAPEPVRRLPTLDEIFRSATPSMVWVNKLDSEGRRYDRCSGFVAGKNRIVTAFQAIDTATKLLIEFAGGRTVETDQVIACSRTGDWAVVKADTADVAALSYGDPQAIVIGERLIAFNIAGGARIIGGVDISGRENVPRFGQRIQFSPSLSTEAAGGPLFDKEGHVVAILGGSVAPGARLDRRITNTSPSLWVETSNGNAAVPITALPRQLDETGVGLAELLAAGKLTPSLAVMPEFIYAGTTRVWAKDATDPLPEIANEFSARDQKVWVFSVWQRKGKLSKGTLTAKIHDEENRVRGELSPQKITLSTALLRSGFGFPPSQLNPGFYRIDLIWDGLPVWRTFIRIVP